MKTMKTAALTLFAAAAFAAPVIAPAIAPAIAQEVSYNAAVTSNYIWRGTTQTNDNAAFQAGADIDFGNNFYAGAWASNVDYGDDTTYELNLYAGYGFDAAGLSYDIGYLAYTYDGNNELNIAEVYGSVSANGLGFSAAYQIDNDGTQNLNHVYYNLGYETDMGAYTIGVAAGLYDLDEAEEQQDYALTISRDAFTLSLTDTDLPDSDPEITLSYGLEF